MRVRCAFVMLVMELLGMRVAGGQEPLQQFVDVAPRAGVDMADSHYNGYVVGWGDYDQDGWLDLYIGIGGGDGWIYGPGAVYPNRSTRLRYNRLYHNEGNGTFQDVTAKAGVLNSADATDVAWGDYDNDGWLDLYCSNADTTGLLFHNEGDGTFRDVTGTAGVLDTAQGGMGAAWADYDRDGWLDLYVAKMTQLDVVGASRLYRNLGDGTFEEVASTAGVARPGMMAAWGDYDQDGWSDLVVTNAGYLVQLTPKTVWVYRNQGDGTFQEVGLAVGLGPFASAAHGVAWGDCDNDGWLDLGIARVTTPHAVYRNRTGDMFERVWVAGIQDRWGTDLSWIDIDCDGWLDLYVGAATGSRVYLNQGGETFLEASRLLGVYSPPKASANNDGVEGAAWGDYNHDGFPDLYVAGGPPSELYRNPGNRNHWLIAQPVGVRSNRSAIGAKVWLCSGEQRQFREINGGSGYGSHSLSGAAFGVGVATRIDSLIVWWPSGQVDHWMDLAVDQAIEVVEGQTPTFQVLYGTGAWQINRPTAFPNVLFQGESCLVRLAVRVVPPVPGRRPDQLTVDLRGIGGARAVALRDDGQMGDDRADDGIWSRTVRVAPTVPAADYGLPVVVRDARGQPHGSATRIRVTVWPGDQAIYTDSLAAGWIMDVRDNATSDLAATEHVHRGRVAHRLQLDGGKATVGYRAVDPLGMPVWGARAVECWVWGETVEAVRALTLSGMTLFTGGIRPVAKQWSRIQIPIQQVIEKSQGLTDRVPEVVFGRSRNGGPVEVWVDDVRIVAAPYPGARKTAVAEELQDDQQQVAFLPNVPNPFNAETLVRYQVGGVTEQHVGLWVHSLAGQIVRTLVEEEQRSGVYTVRWDGRDKQGREVASGVYLARLRSGTIAMTQKLLLLR